MKSRVFFSNNVSPSQQQNISEALTIEATNDIGM